MVSIAKQLEALTNKDWSDLSAEIGRESNKFVSNPNEDLKYRYIGEIDDPSEMFYYFATIEDVAKCRGKTNWFICSDGTFFTCGDSYADDLLNSGKIINITFSFERERREKYNLLSKEEKISFRIALQGITENEAKEIVYCELGIPAYKNIYIFLIKELLFNDYDESIEENEFIHYVESDTENEAKEKIESEFRKVGSIVRRGTIFSPEDRSKMRKSGKTFGYEGGIDYTVILKSRDISLIEVKDNTL